MIDRHNFALEKLKQGTVIPATPLALNTSRKFDKRRQRALFRYYLAAGCGGIAIGVHTTQFAIRDPQIGLFEPILKLAAQEMSEFEKAENTTVVKIAGACGNVEQAVQEAKTAKEFGYDAVLLSPGGLQSLSEADLLERTREVAKIIPVIGFYLQPSVGGRVFTFDYWQKLCEIDNVVAIKCASFNRYQTIDVVRAVALSSRADEIALYTGNDDNIVVDLLTEYKFFEGDKTYTKRFVGGLLGHWSVWAGGAVSMFEKIKTAVKMGSLTPDLLTLAAQVTDANAAFFDTANNFAGCIAGIHEVLRRQGLWEGIWCLDPHEKLSKGQMEEIDRVCRAYPHLNDNEFVEKNLQKWLREV